MRIQRRKYDERFGYKRYVPNLHRSCTAGSLSRAMMWQNSREIFTAKSYVIAWLCATIAIQKKKNKQTRDCKGIKIRA
jgi:hypothetical protein